MITTEKTLSEVMEILRQRGYTEDFNLLEVSATYTPEVAAMLRAVGAPRRAAGTGTDVMPGC